MSLPIGATPVLRGKAAVAFLKKIYAEENIPSYPVPTPKLDEAYRLAKEYAAKHSKPQDPGVTYKNECGPTDPGVPAVLHNCKPSEPDIPKL